MGVLFAIVPFLAFNGFCDRAEAPGDAPLTVEFLLSFLAQFPPGNKSGHEHHLPFHGVSKLYHRSNQTATEDMIPDPAGDSRKGCRADVHIRGELTGLCPFTE